MSLVVSQFFTAAAQQHGVQQQQETSAATLLPLYPRANAACTDLMSFTVSAFAFGVTVPAAIASKSAFVRRLAAGVKLAAADGVNPSLLMGVFAGIRMPTTTTVRALGSLSLRDKADGLAITFLSRTRFSFGIEVSFGRRVISC